ncbi:unnamed protein product [Miscanthus lutarioriparius]|uniref:Uncharacterized protein n=1 Tax=Miscanthus lutarioriparius TaxID=422564 RepID=A0A811PCM6_9POAL|nr:unnamed protein product [Miscanthus lutarioriparius]
MAVRSGRTAALRMASGSGRQVRAASSGRDSRRLTSIEHPSGDAGSPPLLTPRAQFCPSPSLFLSPSLPEVARASSSRFPTQRAHMRSVPPFSPVACSIPTRFSFPRKIWCLPLDSPCPPCRFMSGVHRSPIGVCQTPFHA